MSSKRVNFNHVTNIAVTFRAPQRFPHRKSTLSPGVPPLKPPRCLAVMGKRSV